MNRSRHIPLSVIVVNRNTSGLLVRCLDHIRQSVLEDTYEVIVVDNGSTDDSAAAVRDRYPDVTLMEAGRNLGFAAANNRAAAVARGEFLLLVNTDALLQPHCAEYLIALMRRIPRIGMAGPQLLNADGTPQTSYEAVPTLATETLNRSLLKRLFPSKYPGKGRRLLSPEPVEALIGAVMMIRREALDEVGGFDEGYFFFLEETDLAVRMRKAGWKIIHEPRAIVVHLQGATAKTYQAAARIEFYRSRYLFFQKHYGSRATSFLKTVLRANLLLNVLFLGLASFVTLGKIGEIHERFLVRSEIRQWHRRGCPPDGGLPRT